MAEKWIQNAIKNPGALRAKAGAAGEINKQGNIKPGFIAKEAKSTNQTTRRQANLAKTLGGFKKKGK